MDENTNNERYPSKDRADDARQNDETSAKRDDARLNESSPRRFPVPENDRELLAQCDVQAFRASGPGGQGVNTTDSAVRLTHRPTGITIVARTQRSQLQNKYDALARLRRRLEELNRVPVYRKPTKPTSGSRRRRLDAKRRAGTKKQMRRRPDDDD